MADYDPHAADYEIWAADMVEDVQWYVSLARGATEPIVELAVGTGRVAVSPGTSSRSARSVLSRKRASA